MNRERPNKPPRPRGGGKSNEPDPYNGLILVDKPATWTSHDVVAKIRNHFKFKKVGHGGTLDPMATGLLVILVGRGTKMSAQVMGSDKTYEGVFHLGISTDSQDRDGVITEERDPSGVTQDMLAEEMAKYRGDIQQIPPMVSAIKKDGVPLYKLARKGQTIEREPRLIHVYEFSLKGFDPPKVSFLLRCTKGTYVRTLASDIGDGLNCGAHLSELRRTRSGLLSVDDAMTLDDLLTIPREELGSYVLTASRYRALEQDG